MYNIDVRALVKQFAFRRYNKNILFAIIEQVASNINEENDKSSGRNSHHHCLDHRELKRKTEQELDQFFHPATFSKYLRLLVDSNILSKSEDRKRGQRVEYRLIRKALKEYRAGVLQISTITPTIEVFADEEERRRLYHLLFTIETIEPQNLQEIYDTQRGILKRIRKEFGVQLKPRDLKIQSREREEVDCIVTHYKPVLSSCISLSRRDHYNNNIGSLRSRNQNPKYYRSLEHNRSKPALYHVKVNGFSINDILSYERRFGFVSISELTKAKVKRSIKLLVGTEIIVPIGKLGRQTKYSFANPKLRQMVGNCLVVLSHTKDLLLSKVWQYERKVNKQERKWLESIYGKRQAGRIISDNYDFFISRGKAVIKDKQQYEQEKIALFGFVKNEAEELRRRYATDLVLKNEYAFLLEPMIKEMIFPLFIEDSLEIKQIRQQRKSDWINRTKRRGSENSD